MMNILGIYQNDQGQKSIDNSGSLFGLIDKEGFSQEGQLVEMFFVFLFDIDFLMILIILIVLVVGIDLVEELIMIV